MSYESESKLTFGNILLGLLLLGVVVVIGLIVFVYFALTKNSSSKSNFKPNDTPPAQTIDQLSPEGKTLPPVPRAQATDGSKPTAASAANNQTAQADKIAKDLGSDAPSMVGRDVVVGSNVGERAETKPKPKPKPKPKQVPANPDTANANSGATGEKPLTPTHRIAGERELQPINKRTQRSDNVATGERTLTPNNRSTGERALQPNNRNTQPSRPIVLREREDSGSRSNSGGERPLKPVEKPRNSNNGGGSDNIGNLF